jgi:hypothetical protein
MSSHSKRKSYGVPAAIVAILIFLFFMTTPYYKYFPQGIIGSIIAYFLIAAFFISALLAINSVSGWESDLKTWLMYGLGFILFILSIFVFSFTVFLPYRAQSYNVLFAVALFFIALFTLFRVRRRTGIFVYRGE